MAKFKVGDKVRILDGSSIEKYTGYWDKKMSDYIGKTSEINYVIERGYEGRTAYHLKDSPYIWDERGLQYANDFYIPPYAFITEMLKESGSISFENGSSITVIPKEKEKMSTSIGFYTFEGTRIDKTNNTKIPTITTKAYELNSPFGEGVATCDASDYDMRQGVLEAVANMYCGGNFDREYRKAVKMKERDEMLDRTCIYCGKVFDTVEECETHEAWHVERKKARRERYLLRKRAKEIAFEEQAQKMAKEIIADEGRKKT